MYAKLAFRNMRRSTKNYLIYFITVILTVTLIYSFMALGFSDEILSMSENMSMLTSGIFILSVLVALVSSFVISYAIRYMLNQRKKEFAIYELLGMEIRTIQKLFLLENIFIGIAAFFIGVVIGTGLSGVLAQIVKNIFTTSYTYQIIFLPNVFVVTLLLFLIMYGVGIIHAARIIRHQKIVELLYDNHKNEEVPDGNIFKNILIICFSAALLGVGIFSLKNGISEQTNKAWLFFIAAITLIFSGVYGIYRNIPYMLITLSKRSIKINYSNANLFYFGQISRRIQSCGRLLAITAILLTISLATMFIGLAMGGGYKVNIEAYYPYDVGIAIDAPLTKGSFSSVISFVNERSAVNDSLVYYLYTADGYAIEALAFSDYSHLRSMLGLAPVELQENQYLVHCDTWTYQEEIQNVLAEQSEIILAGNTLDNPQTRIYKEPMEQYQMAGTKGYVLVVSDIVAEKLSADKIRTVMKLDNGGYAELKGEIRQFLNDSGTAWQPQLQSSEILPEKVTFGVSVKAWGIANSLTGFTVSSFCGLYLSIVFILLSCTILAFEQLSTIDNNKRNYEIIDKMGVSKETQKRLIHCELITFFFIPLVLPVLVIIILIVGTQNLYGDFILQEGLIYVYGAMTLMGFGVIYFAYYEATSYLFKRNMGIS